jgi:hypothetical protein
MPAKDAYHDIVVNALKKDGWDVINEQVRLVIGDRWMWVDIQADKIDEKLSVLIEVKGFENIPSPIAYLQSVVGQYMIYRVILDYLEWEHPLYLSVPDHAFNDILGEEIGVEVIKQVGMKILTFSVEREEIIQWTT